METKDLKDIKESQRKQIKAWLLRGRTITQIEAIEMWKCYRLASRICELRKEGMAIRTDMIPLQDGSNFARYVYTGKIKAESGKQYTINDYLKE